ncbi:hypothetical protein CEE37_11560 [candidate division LCP-89 bacterium B3_LCP]|uniref:Uncharacterized protein n=1 Tax=candidate division LCP-89 bacterium B3_LCP TaxID=2012998 RepID=A0A532UVU3_UNCL8|nr:MAG: hypothetical protein CEE37_11560 [candidate division LCP-89 bacterium B3_LCP]
MRVLLIQPSSIVTRRGADNAIPYLPLGLGSIASVLRKADHEVQILDALTEGWGKRGKIDDDLIEIGLSEEEVAVEVRAFSPQVVGISVPFTSQAPRLRSIARWVKAIHPEIFVVCGGNHATSAPHDVAEIPDIDMVFLGEAERSFAKFLSKLEKGEIDVNIKGIAYRDVHGGVVVKPKMKFRDDCDSLPLPAYDLMPLKKYFKAIGKRSMPVFVSRGCEKTCSYCTTSKIFGKKTRFIPYDAVVDNIKHLLQYYGTREFTFEDDRLLSNSDYAHNLFDKLIEENLNIQWVARNDVDPSHLDDQLLLKMKRSGGKRLHFAPQSGSRRVLKKILKKPVDLFMLEKAIERSLAVGFKVTCHFILGSPGETIEEVYNSLNFAWKLRSLGADEFHFSLATPYPGTGIREQAETLDGIYQFNEFRATPYEGSISTDEINAAEIVRIRDNADREFNSRGLVMGLRQRVNTAPKPNKRLEERFFHSVAPQQPSKEVPLDKRIALTLVEESA